MANEASRRGSIIRLLAATSLAAAFLSVGTIAQARHVSRAALTHPATSGACDLHSAGNAIQHVIYIVFDNVHYRRDNPNVPSDIQQMPNLLNFMKGNGTFLTSEHTPLIAHTADDILTSMTGVYGDRHGQPISNSYDYYDKTGVPHYTSSFEYWTDPSPDETPYMVDQQGKIAPAPWVPFTRAGCNVGAFSTANIELENVGYDLSTVFGPNSPQVQEAKANQTKAVTDFEGLAIHCAAANLACSSSNGGVPDRLPNEPGGYIGYRALFGAKYVNPYLTGGQPVLNDLNGRPIQDSSGNPGFPGFDPTAAQSLAYTAAMQEHGVPVTFTYIADTHDNHSAENAFGPGEAGYVAQNRAYNIAFGKFFANLSKHGITKSNTLFVVTSDEGDHFAGTKPGNPGCNGVTTPCQYENSKGSYVGEFAANMAGLLTSQAGITTPFDIHFDTAPTFYLNNQPSQTNESITRPFERAVGQLTAANPITGKRERITKYMADQAEMRLLHMMTSDPLRDATFTDFADPNYYFQTYNRSGAPCDPSGLVCVNNGHAWNHGDVGRRINTTFLGMVGPGVKQLGITHRVWADHADDRPTILALVGLKDDYSHEGRVLTEILTKSGLNAVERQDRKLLHKLGVAYKAINACVGPLSLATLAASTRAMESGSPADDGEYRSFVSEVTDLTHARNDLALEMESTIENAEFSGQSINREKADLMIRRADGLLAWANDMAMSDR